MERLRTENGACTSLGRSDIENACVMTAAIAAFLCGFRLQKRHRSAGDDVAWTEVTDLPTDFTSDCFRIVM